MGKNVERRIVLVGRNKASNRFVYYYYDVYSGGGIKVSVRRESDEGVLIRYSVRHGCGIYVYDGSYSFMDFAMGLVSGGRVLVYGSKELRGKSDGKMGNNVNSLPIIL